MSDYPRREMLVDGAWLQQHLQDPHLRVVDCDPPDSYRRAHLPGAVGVADNWFKRADDRRFVMGPEEFARAMSSLGIGDETDVVVYDGSGTHYCARLWWCLSYYGHRSVRVLEGGWRQWVKEGRPIGFDEMVPPAARFTPRPDESLRATVEEVRNRLERPGVVVLDVRSDEEWEGKNDRGNKRAGHMPGAVHIEWTNNVTADAMQRLKPASDLLAMYQAAGVTPDKEVITVCQAGVRAAQAAMTLRLLGYDRVRDYDGSFLEWANRDDTPLV